VSSRLPVLILCASTAAQAGGKSWLDHWRESTVALGVARREGGKQIFAAVATGVIVGSVPGQKRPWLVTAKHVFYNPAENWEPSYILVRFSWFEMRTVGDYLGVAVPLKQNGRRTWVAHPDPDVDLAYVPLSVTPQEAGRSELQAIVLSQFALPTEVYEAAPVLVLGYPAAVGAGFQVRALLRQGVIAWVSPDRPAAKPFLIDANIFPGNSGGPVLYLPQGIDPQGHVLTGGSVKFLGLVSQTRTQSTLIATSKSQPEQSVPLNFLGIGVIEPAQRVRELVLTPPPE
jgi:hypothetical protein